MPLEAKTLGLVGDGDEVALIEQIESSFNIKFSNSDLSEVGNIGQLYDVTIAKINGVNTNRKSCLTATAFRLLKSEYEQQHITPSTPLGLDGKKLQSLLERYKEKNLLRLPQHGNQYTGKISLFLSVAVSLILLVYGIPWLILPAALLTFVITYIVLYKLLSPSYPYRTYGDIAKEAVRENFARLAHLTGTCHPDDVWQTFVEIIEWHTGLNEPIGRETALLS